MKKKFSDEIEQDLISYETLKEMRFLSLKRRVVLIQQRYGITVNPSTLRNLYRRKKVTYRSAKKAIR